MKQNLQIKKSERESEKEKGDREIEIDIKIPVWRGPRKETEKFRPTGTLQRED